MASLWEQESARIKASVGAQSPEGIALRRASDAVRAAVQDQAETAAAVAKHFDTGIKAIQLAAAGGFPQYARDYVRIRVKSGALQPLLLNRAQLYMHSMAEAQLERMGYVRIIVLKGRQMGASTYIVARGYFKVSRRSGQKAYILTHELNATANLFAKVKGIHDEMPDLLRPTLGKSNAKELTFPGLGSEYVVGTAKEGDTGRSLTVQFFHGSECAFWRAAKEIFKGLMQAIGTIGGTEAWLESTANGIGNSFHSMVQAARKGSTDFQLCFCPWYWDPGYCTPPELIPAGFADTLTLDDREYMSVHDLSLGQMHWRSKKIAEFAMSEGGSLEDGAVQFCQEYPATVEEAFQSDQEGAYIRAVKVIMARKAWRDYVSEHGIRPQGVGKKRMGIDPSYTGGDGFRVWCRQGRVAWRAAHWSKKRTLQSVSMLLEVFEREQPDEIFIDVGNNGGPIYDLLVDTVWGSRIIPVLFGEAADDPDRHQNKRCEMWSRVRDWLGELPQVYLEDMDEIQADLTAVLTRRDDVGNRTKLESKDDLIKRLGKGSSPDDGDALALTFAYPSGGPLRGTGSRAPDPARPCFHGSGL